MFVTQDEARRCWCPFARVANSLYAREISEHAEPPAPAHNRHIVTVEDDRCAEIAADYPAMKCIASHCMAWRYDTDVEHGYCGLAGRP